MKRFMYKVKDLYKRLDIKFSWQKLIGVIIGIVAGINFAIWCFDNFDRTPATADDFAILEQQLATIQENRELLLDTEGEATITIILDSPKCKLTVTFDKTLDELKTKYEDKSYTIWEVVAISAFLGIVAGVGIGIVTFIALWIAYFFIVITVILLGMSILIVLLIICFFVWIVNQIYNKFHRFKRQ